MSASPSRAWQALLLLSTHLTFASAAFIPFENCLSSNTLTKKPLQLQWVPYFVDAKFEASSPNNLRLTFYGNVTGQQVEGTYPPPNSPSWQNDNNHFGKITNIGNANKFSTLFTHVDVLSYSAWNASASKFCNSLTQGSCPLGPQFYANPDDPSDLAAFSIDHDFHSQYQFSTLASKVYVYSGDSAKQEIVCITANVTPYLGKSISAMITWLPAAILTFKGIATLVAAIWSPWGSSDIFRWSSNYGRDADLLRLVTPGFGDCLQYIQFVTLLGSLTLQYPGFYQPAVSKTAWSLLLFNQSWVSGGPGTQSLVDGIYAVNGTYGLSSMRQLIGMSEDVDIWACMAIWLAVIAAIIIVLTQIGFFSRWLYRLITKTSEEDLVRKNLPFTLGNMVRLLFNFFIIPIIALSLFQLVIAPRSPSSVVACAAILLAIWIISAAWILRVIFTTKPRTHLFDHMSTLLLYGPLYNTYTDIAAPFAFIPISLMFLRGVAFGAAQPSGTAQLIILAISEIILVVTLNGFRPFTNETSMNAYHTFFGVARFITVVLSITFIDSLNVSESSKGWIGYVILLIHACVLIFGFFLNSLQTIVEVVARSLGLASGARGSILSWRMLKKRQDRPNTPGSHAAMLRGETDDEHHRSMSISSQQLLNQAGGATPSSHRNSNLDNNSNGGDAGEYTYYGSPNEQGPMHRRSTSKLDGDTFYRPPRKRTLTNDALNPVLESMNEDVPRHGGTESPRPAFLRDRADSGAGSVRTDYAVREADLYYNRGPALNEQQTRKLKTGPADPEGPAANAQSWLQGLWLGMLGKKGKEKEAGKGFEVVRSSRMPPEMQQEIARHDEMELQEKSKPEGDFRYRDELDTPYEDLQAADGEGESSRLSGPGIGELPTGRVRSGSKEAFDFGFQPNEMMARDASHPGLRAEQSSSRQIAGDATYEQSGSGSDWLGTVDTGKDINMPSFSRLSSQRSTAGSQADVQWTRRLNRDYSKREYSQRTSKQGLLPSRDPSDASRGRETTGDDSNPLHRHDTIESYDGNVLETPIGEEDRPSSFLQTNYHRTADRITRNSFGANAALQGVSAEVIPGSLPEAENSGGYLIEQSKE